MKNAFDISGPAIGSALYSIGGFGVPFWTVGSLGLVCAVLIFFLLPSVKPKSTDSSYGNSKKHLTVKAIFSVSAHYVYMRRYVSLFIFVLLISVSSNVAAPF